MLLKRNNINKVERINVDDGNEVKEDQYPVATPK